MKRKTGFLCFGSLAMILGSCGPTFPMNSSSAGQTADPTPFSSSAETQSVPSASNESDSSSAAAPSSSMVPVEETIYDKYPGLPRLENLPDVPTITIYNPEESLDFVTQPSRFDKWDYTACSISVDSPSAREYDMENIPGGVKVRGNYTSNYDKKPLRIKFDKKQQMLGLNNGTKQKSWVLLADVKDSSMHRNQLAFLLGKMLLEKDGLYCSDFIPAQVSINGNYWGLYTLVEQQQTGTDRVNVAEPEDDYEGTDTGYFFEFDGYYTDEPPVAQGGDPTFTMRYEGGTTNYGQKGYTVKSDITNELQIPFLSNYMSNLYKLGAQATRGFFYDFNDDFSEIVRVNQTNEEAHIAKYFDIDSFVDMYIISEIFCDPDIGWSSFYLSVDMSQTGSKKLRLEAPWDWDSAAGNRSTYCEDAKGYYSPGRGNPWLEIFANRGWFKNRVTEKWEQLKTDGCLQYLFDFMDAMDKKYSNAYDANFARWNHVGGNYSGTAGELRTEVVQCQTQHEETMFLTDWLADRLTNLDALFSDGENIGPKEDEVAYPTNPVEVIRLEAENCVLTGGGRVRTADPSDGASNNGYIGNIDGVRGAEMAFSLNVPNAVKGALSFGLAKQINRRAISEMYELFVNGEPVELPLRFNAQANDMNNRYHEWGQVLVAEINLQEGQNQIVVKTKGSGTNFDYIEVAY